MEILDNVRVDNAHLDLTMGLADVRCKDVCPIIGIAQSSEYYINYPARFLDEALPYQGPRQGVRVVVFLQSKSAIPPLVNNAIGVIAIPDGAEEEICVLMREAVQWDHFNTEEKANHIAHILGATGAIKELALTGSEDIIELFNLFPDLFIPLLIKATADENNRYRFISLRALSRLAISRNELVGYLISNLTSTDRQIRKKSAEELRIVLFALHEQDFQDLNHNSIEAIRESSDGTIDRLITWWNNKGSQNIKYTFKAK